MNKIVFFDFDGVLFDTIKEAFIVMRMTLGKNPLKTKKFESEYYKNFQKYYHLVKYAWHFFYYHEALTLARGNDKVDIGGWFTERIAKSTRNVWFEEKFIESRNEIRKNYYDFWISFSKPFPFFDEIKPVMVSAIDRCFVVSTKDSKTIKHLLHDQSVFMPVYGSEKVAAIGSKKKIIQGIMEKFNVEQAMFIDDSADHLNEFSNDDQKKIVLRQPDWGYGKETVHLINCDDLVRDIKVFLELK